MSRRIAILLLLFVLAVNVYRAWTQSITADEAYACSLYLTGPWSQLLGPYEACHHVLYTLLSKLSISLFGLSEFTLRIPSLLGGLLYLLTIYRLARRLFGEGPVFLLATGLLSLNPLLMDYMSAARGYGLALALFLWSLYQMLRYTDAGARQPVVSPDPSLLAKAGIGLGLSVAANLTLLVPVAVLTVGFLAVLVADRELGGPRVAGRLSLGLGRFVFPCIVTAFIILVLPLSKAHRSDFYVGQPSLQASLINLLALSLYHHPLSGLLAGMVPKPGFWIGFLARAYVPLVLTATVLACVAALYRWVRGKSFARLDCPTQFLLLGGGTLLLALAALVWAHHAFQLLYPHGRTGLYLIPLFILTALILPVSIRGSRSGFLLAGLLVWTISLLCLAQFLAQFQTSCYGEYRFDAATKTIVGVIRQRQTRQPLRRVRVGISWVLEPSMNFYRRMYNLDWMEPLDRKGPDGDFDYYMLTEQDVRLIKSKDLSVLYADEPSGITLAVPGRSPVTR
jgi:hypothetical protein